MFREPRIIGRIEEKQKLDRCIERNEAQLIVVSGRRRIGKTFLINQYFENRFDFKLTGEYKASREIQLENFLLEMNRRTNTKNEAPKNWKDAFELLTNYLMSLPAEKKAVVFFDEMPWMDTQRSGFISAFEYFWNSFGSAQNNLIFILSGSASSWISDNIMHNKGGLFNRRTCSLQLQPFCLSETEAYLQMIGIEWSRYDIAECYMILGGIPYYLSFLNPYLSLSENIDSLFFRKSAELSDEFDCLYRTLFAGSEDYIQIVSLLSRKRSGLTLSEISEKSGMPLNGNLTKKINNLCQSGFVRANPFYNQKKRDVRYQLVDYYTLFYHRFIKEHYGKDERFWEHTYDNPSKHVWAGLTFELLCRDHIEQIRQRLGISGVMTELSTWYSRAEKPEEKDSGAQIDLIIDRRDHTVSLCEIKYSLNEFEIDKAYEASLRNKIERFRQETATTKTLQLVMITTFGVKKNKYSNIVSGQATLDDLFRPVY